MAPSATGIQDKPFFDYHDEFEVREELSDIPRSPTGDVALTHAQDFLQVFLRRHGLPETETRLANSERRSRISVKLLYRFARAKLSQFNRQFVKSSETVDTVS